MFADTDPANRGRNSLGQLRVVVECRRIFALDHLNDRRAVFRNARRQGHAFRNPFDGSNNPQAHVFFEGSGRELQRDFVGNDVALSAAVNRADRDHRRLEW